MLQIILKNIILFPVLISFFYYYKGDDNKTDMLLVKADENLHVDFTETLKYAKEASVLAEATENSEQKALAYYYIARSLIFYRDFEDADIYLEKGLREDAVKKDILLKSMFLTLESGYYSRMSFFEKSFQKNKEALSLLESNVDLESRIMTSFVYIKLADDCTEMKNYELAHSYADQSIAIIEKIPVQKYLSAKKIYRNKAFIYFYKSWIFLQQQKPQEALPFIQKAYRQAILEKIDYLALFYEIYGDYYYQTNNYQVAIGFYLKAIENKNKFKQYSAYVDSKISKAYGMLGDLKNEKYYLKRAEERHKIDLKEYTQTIQKELNRILAKENLENTHIKRINSITILTVSISSILLLTVVVVQYQKSKKRKKAIIEKQKRKLSEKQIEVERLREKINGGFSELVDLIKNNSPMFWGRFQEIHPEFCKKLLTVNESLKVSELTLCAYIYLGFSTKEIADYTYKAYKTIENNRSNLRKKLELDSKIDMTVWLREYIVS